MDDLRSRFPVVITQDLVWGDMDAFAHINNTVYFRYFEDVRIEFFKHIQVLEYMERTRIGPILASVRCDFRAPLTFPDRIQVGTIATGFETKRFTMKYLVHSESLGKVAAEGEGVIVYYDYRQKRSCAIPGKILASIKSLQADFT